MIGSVVNYRYEILEKIGDGSFFSVYKARDKVLNRLVAIKMLHPKYSENEDFAQRICAEIQATENLIHPNISRAFECDHQDEQWFIATEFVRGINLKERIKRTGLMAVSAVVGIAIAVCEALDYAHRQGFVHGDVRPQNILVSPDGDVKLTDFGVAPALSAFPTLHASSMFRSVHYMSPEVAEGKPVQPTSDIYSLGVVMYEMLTGSLPFDAETPIGIALKHAKELPQPPQMLNAGIPKALETIVLKALEKSPSERYVSARAMLNDLLELRETLRTGKTVKLSQPAEEEPDAEEVSSSNWISGAFKSVLLILAVMVTVFGLLFLYLTFTNPPEVQVPDLIGKTMDEATSIADITGVRLVEIDQQYNDRFPEGEIMLTSPIAGMRMKKGRIVKVWVSKGSRYAEVPDLRDMSEEHAREAILKADLAIGEISQVYDDNVEPGSVVRQSPKSGSKHDRGTAVNLVLSQGPKPQEVPTGDEQTTGEGDQRSFDVKFTVPDGSPDPSKVKIVVVDSMSRNTVYEEDKHPGDQVETTVYGYGDRVEIRIYINGEEVSKEVK